MELFTRIYNGRGRGDGFDASVYKIRPNELNQPGGIGFVVLLQPTYRGGITVAQWAETEAESLDIARYGQPGGSFAWEDYCKKGKLRPRF